ncbi:hypothetical protein PV703_09375 [Streptomyces sp. ME01-24h]|nr:hypothetical protein [Streptomyces sp. ME19-03-3]MDX3353527.1 hypothetical protein [Streptomyces sp. ME01-24h]
MPAYVPARVRARVGAALAIAALVAGAGPAAATAGAAARLPDVAECRTSVRGGEGVAVCFNPDPDLDRVQLHIECLRWWDPDVDGAPVPVGPAETVTLSDRCWKEIQEVWVTGMLG